MRYLGERRPEAQQETEVGQFHRISIQRRLADYGFSKTTTWAEMVSEHQKWMRNYNIEHHFPHWERQDGRHSPDEVLRGVLSRTSPEPVFDCILYATRFTRYLDRYGYVRLVKHR
jgi:hypothetical protein